MYSIYQHNIHNLQNHTCYQQIQNTIRKRWEMYNYLSLWSPDRYFKETSVTHPLMDFVRALHILVAEQLILCVFLCLFHI